VNNEDVTPFPGQELVPTVHEMIADYEKTKKAKTA